MEVVSRRPNMEVAFSEVEEGTFFWYSKHLHLKPLNGTTIGWTDINTIAIHLHNNSYVVIGLDEKVVPDTDVFKCIRKAD
jgi:hypothetical protein|tara:strand:- start:15321 stop:15560 length:240 start_codon:yes stop_codon:yes gene_type:complete